MQKGWRITVFAEAGRGDHEKGGGGGGVGGGGGGGGVGCTHLRRGMSRQECYRASARVTPKAKRKKTRIRDHSDKTKCSISP